MRNCIFAFLILFGTLLQGAAAEEFSESVQPGSDVWVTNAARPLTVGVYSARGISESKFRYEFLYDSDPRDPDLLAYIAEVLQLDLIITRSDAQWFPANTTFVDIGPAVMTELIEGIASTQHAEPLLLVPQTAVDLPPLRIALETGEIVLGKLGDFDGKTFEAQLLSSDLASVGSDRRRIDADKIIMFGRIIPDAESTLQTGILDQVGILSGKFPSYAASAPDGSTGYSGGSSGEVYVRGYYRKDGTYVRPHYRSKPKKR